MMNIKSIDIGALTQEINSILRALPSLNVANMRGLRQEISDRLVTVPPRDVIALGLSLLDEPLFEHRFLAYELVAYHPPALHSLDEVALGQFGQGMADWATVDTFSLFLAGPAWRERQVPDSFIYGWTNASDYWWRRAALVSTVALNNPARGGQGDTPRTLRVCQLLIGDREDMVIKALSWALRELAKREPERVNRFLADYEDQLAARVKREVRNKLEAGLKNP